VINRRDPRGDAFEVFVRLGDAKAWRVREGEDAGSTAVGDRSASSEPLQNGPTI